MKNKQENTSGNLLVGLLYKEVISIQEVYLKVCVYECSHCRYISTKCIYYPGGQKKYLEPLELGVVVRAGN